MAKEEGKGMVPYRLSLFQGMRKSLFLYFLDKNNVYNYLDLPGYLKNDDEVIAEVMAIKPSLISYIPTEKAIEYIGRDSRYIKYITNIDLLDYLIENKPETIRFFDNEFIKSYIEMEPSLVTYLDEKQIKHLAYSQDYSGNKEFLHFLPTSVQEDLILGRETTEISKHLASFSEEAIINAAIRDELIYKSYMGKKFRNFRWLEKYDLKQLPISTQIKLISVSPDYVYMISPEAVTQFVNGNPLLYKFLPENMKLDLIKEDREQFAKMPEDFQFKALQRFPKAAKNTYYSGYFNKQASSGAEEDIISFTRKGKDLTQKEIEEIVKDKNDVDYILKIGMYNPELVFVKQDRSSEENRKLIDIFVQKASKIDEYGKLTRILKQYSSSGEKDPNGSKEEIEKINRAIKIVLNDDLLKKVHFEELGQFVENPTHETLVQIIRNTYGEDSAMIVQDKQDIVESQIPNYYIFKPELIETIGSNNVYSAIYSKINNSGMLSEIARKPELAEAYKKFCSIAEGFFDNTPVGLNEKLSGFADSKKLLENISTSDLSQIQKNNFIIALMDRRDMFAGNSKPQEFISFPNDIISLSHYQEKRNKILDEAIQIEDDPTLVKDYISKRFFGMSFGNMYDNNGIASPNKLNHIRKSQKFTEMVENKKAGLSSGEMDYFEICTLLGEANDINSLRNIHSLLCKKSVQMNPIRFNNFEKKLKENRMMYISREELNRVKQNFNHTIKDDDSDIVKEIKVLLGYKREGEVRE